ncbi:MAG: hypothetical protein M1319_04390 [Chloroflexi bacterium]|nr:hypothetical protein [Chloroflexota bacterium]
MKIVDKVESIKWLASKGVIDSEGTILRSSFPRQATYYITSLDSGAKTVIARTLMLQFAKFDESMLWIDEYKVWPAAENWNLFDGYRRSLGERKPLWERPGHIFAPGDGETVFSLLCMVLYFIWGAIVAPASGELVVRISHDDWIDIYAKEDMGAEEDTFTVVGNVIGHILRTNP